MNASGSTVNIFSCRDAESVMMIQYGFSNFKLSSGSRILLSHSYCKSMDDVDLFTRYKFSNVFSAADDLKDNPQSLFKLIYGSLVKLVSRFLIIEPSCWFHKAIL